MSEKKYCFGVDVGGTTVKLGLFETTGVVLDKWEIVTVTDGDGSQILPDIAAAIEAKIAEKALDREEIAGVGIGVPGPVDADGTIYRAVNLNWGVFNIKNVLEDLLHLPVAVGNDANVAALGEVWQGGAKGYKNVVVLTLGTGVGGGIIIDGQILPGSKGAAGEIGHLPINYEETEVCGCGNKGCLEQYVSATGCVRLANRKLAASDKPSMLRDMEVTAKNVWDAVKAGDELAMEVADEFGWYLGRAAGMVACVVNPEVFVIGGGVSRAGEILIDYIMKYFPTYTFHGCRNAKFVLAELGNDAGIFGAAKQVL